MDDLITGGETPGSVIKLKGEISDILGTAGFDLRKYASNSASVLKHCTDKTSDVHILKSEVEKRTLGIIWDSECDVLRYETNVSHILKSATKRAILGIIAQVFDPLGLVSPIVIKAKIFLQRLWAEHLGWDDEISRDLRLEWTAINEDLGMLNNIVIPRQVMIPNYVKLELHGFCDSSEVAYGSAIYIRSMNKDGKIQVSLLCSKSRVAPIKKLTLPRLELCGACILSKLVHDAIESLKVKFDAIHYWTDSSIVLNWIKSDPNRWKTFVSNRVTKIQLLSKPDQWHHVRGTSNPADMVSRGVFAKNLCDSTWFQGPKWLSLEQFDYASTKSCDVEDQITELKISKISSVSLQTNDIFSKFSNLNTLKRVTAWCKRFISNCRLKTKNFTPLTTKEANEAMTSLLKMVQAETFGEDYKSIIKCQPLNNRSQLLHLNPFLDEEGLIRVGGRLKHSSLDFEHKYPIVLPKKHIFTILLIKHEHLRLLHAGAQAVLASIRQNYWPLSGRSIVRQVLRRCITCFKAKPTNVNPIMGNLPQQRINPVRAFYSAAVDYAGPFLIKDGKLRNRKLIKSYLCIFVCFVTKAVHLELVTDMSTESFLNMLKRFVARRGLPKMLYSDNGTNFVGAYNLIKTMYNNLKIISRDESFQNYLLNNNIHWQFMPAKSPHMGGLHEAAVKSAKCHIKHVVGNSNLTYENLYTVLCQIESVLNSRPLVPCSSDPTDLCALTPGHFLIGDILCALPQRDISGSAASKLNLYQRRQQMVQHFWQRWHKEYLHTLQERGKWKKQNNPNLKIGSLVLLKEDGLPCTRMEVRKNNSAVSRRRQHHTSGDGKNEHWNDSASRPQSLSSTDRSLNDLLHSRRGRMFGHSFGNSHLAA